MVPMLPLLNAMETVNVLAVGNDVMERRIVLLVGMRNTVLNKTVTQLKRRNVQEKNDVSHPNISAMVTK